MEITFLDWMVAGFGLGLGALLLYLSVNVAGALLGGGIERALRWWDARHARAETRRRLDVMERSRSGRA